ncbi:hypothetical protein F5141DRAFT_1009515, partial [Pisolithus sp. B1]
DGQRLAYLLRPTSPHGKDLVKEFRNPSVHHLDGCKPYRHVHLIAVRYVLVTTHAARKRPGGAFSEQLQLISYVATPYLPVLKIK